MRPIIYFTFIISLCSKKLIRNIPYLFQNTIATSLRFENVLFALILIAALSQVRKVLTSLYRQQTSTSKVWRTHFSQLYKVHYDFAVILILLYMNFKMFMYYLRCFWILFISWTSVDVNYLYNLIFCLVLTTVYKMETVSIDFKHH